MTTEERVKMFTAWTAEPQLVESEIAEILAMHEVTDSAGVNPGETGYVPTYNLRAAIREGWILKQAKAAELQSTDLDGDRMSANQIFDHCERMVRRYSGTASPVVTAFDPTK